MYFSSKTNQLFQKKLEKTLFILKKTYPPTDHIFHKFEYT